MPTLSTPREHTDMINRREKLRKIVAAIHDYETEHGHFPLAAWGAGNQLSWRIVLLPHLGEQSLYDQINKTVGWDHPDNIKYHDQMPSVFQDPTMNCGSASSFVALSGAGTAWPTMGNSVGFSDVLDGSSNTICLITHLGNEANWMQPPLHQFPTFFQRNTGNKRIDSSCAFLDGHVSEVELPEPIGEFGSSFLIADWSVSRDNNTMHTERRSPGVSQ